MLLDFRHYCHAPKGLDSFGSCKHMWQMAGRTGSATKRLRVTMYPCTVHVVLVQRIEPSPPSSEAQHRQAYPDSVAVPENAR